MLSWLGSGGAVELCPMASAKELSLDDYKKLVREARADVDLSLIWSEQPGLSCTGFDQGYASLNCPAT